jgi:hypothetical protein
MAYFLGCCTGVIFVFVIIAIGLLAPFADDPWRTDKRD